jgi:hypothetical protein
VANSSERIRLFAQFGVAIMQPAAGNRLVSYPAPRIAAEPVSREHFIRRPRRRLVKRGVDLSEAIGFPPSAQKPVRQCRSDRRFQE